MPGSLLCSDGCFGSGDLSTWTCAPGDIFCEQDLQQCQKDNQECVSDLDTMEVRVVVENQNDSVVLSVQIAPERYTVGNLTVGESLVSISTDLGKLKEAVVHISDVPCRQLTSKGSRVGLPMIKWLGLPMMNLALADS